MISGQSTSHRLKPQPEARCNCRRPAVAAGAGDQHSRRPERAGEIVRGEAGPKIEARKPEVGADLRGQPGVRRRKARPNTLVEAAENHQIGMLESSFEQAPN